MSDIRMKKLADVLVNYSTKVQRGDWVHINASVLALPLAKEVMSAVLKAGGNPSITLESPDLGASYIAEADEEQLRWTPPLDMHIIDNVDVWIIVEAPENTRAMTNIDPERQQMRNSAYAEWMDIYMKRSAAGELRWVMTNYPCQALAQDAEMSLDEYEGFVYAATFADQDDPVARWREIYEAQEKLIKWLAGKKSVAIRGPHVDLTMSIAGRSFINSCGDENMPSGEIFTSPVEDSVNGWVEFSYPAIYLGVAVEGARLEFEQGKVVKASAEKGEEFLLKMLDTDAGARILGELGIGTNYGIRKFTKNILYDEKIGGSFHLAVGSGFPEAGGKNESSIHWDLISDATYATSMWADDEIFYQNGKFTV
ncbi:MAG: aminopeptidase [Anaerolineae bacterium]|jgi:aminopeptidase|nr:aminopeptidase [Anaerolineae bacterium]MBT7072060.1 aminopeptidase [Anaerolineae bacterium]MBT7326684.1 aminopeptidase [Anaerolineae bacterium]